MSRLFSALNKLVEKRYRITQIVLVVVLLAVAYFIVLGRQITSIRNDGLFRLQQSKQKQAAEREVLQYTQSVVDKFTKANVQDAAKLRAMAPIRPDLPAMFVQVDALARAAGLQLNNVNFANVSATPTGTPANTGGVGTSAALKQMAVTFSVSGGSGYTSLKSFLGTLENSVRLLDVQSIAYTPGKEGTAEAYQVNAVAYYLGQ